MSLRIEMNMSLTVFLAICVLGLDFMIFVLFNWLYGERNRNRFRRSASRRCHAHSQTPLYCVSGKSESERGPGRADWPATPGRPRIVAKPSFGDSRRQQNGHGGYQGFAGSLARRRVG